MSKDLRSNRWAPLWVLVLAMTLPGFALAACGDDDHTHEDGGAHGDGDGDHGDGDGDHGDAGHGDGDGDGDAGHGNGHTTCGLQANCIDTVDLAEGLEVEGEDGVFSVTVLSHNELSEIDNAWVIEVTDADGERVEDAAVTVSTFSVDCMHPGPSEPAQVTANADGDYEVAPDNAHGGPWDTIFDIAAGGEMDTVTLHLCIPGEEHDMGTGGQDAGTHDM